MFVTDTRYYWKLTRNIFRYNHNNLFADGNIPGGIHTVNECTSPPPYSIYTLTRH